VNQIRLTDPQWKRNIVLIDTWEFRGGSGFLDRVDEWSFCLTAARMAAA
jgi:hypothetical protein